MATDTSMSTLNSTATANARARMQPPKALLDAEWRDIRARRRRESERDDRLVPETLDELPRAGDGRSDLGKAQLFGLAFSGGGIRSAVFNLGVLQALHRFGVLTHVDYLSTVSGGGYIGASASAQLHMPRETDSSSVSESVSESASGDAPGFPFDAQTQSAGGAEAPVVRHMRAHGNYLAPEGLLDYVRIVAVLARGLAVNSVALLPFPALAAGVAAVGFGATVRNFDADRDGVGVVELLRFTPLAALGLLVVLVLSSLARSAARSPSSTPADGRRLRARDRFERGLAWGWVVFGAVVVVELQPALIWGFREGTTAIHAGRGAELVASGMSAFGFASSLLASHLSRSAGLRRVAWMTAGALLGLLIPLSVYLYAAQWLIFESSMFAAADGAMVGLDLRLAAEQLGSSPLFLASVLAWGLLWWGLNINDTSLHGFYRDRLSEAFLVGRARGAADDGDALQSLDDLRLSELGGPGSEAPYHLINTALNLGVGADRELRARRCDAFLFSKYYTGSISTGYCSTSVLESVVPRLDLGTAMAISGAAAAPSQGRATMRPLVMLMTLLNLRLGYWLPCPGTMAAARDRSSDGWLSTLLARARGRPGPFYLLRELFGRVGRTSPLVNVSDGGHVENLAVYELLRRRCRYIICCDAEADPDMAFAGLANLLVSARVDLGVEIDIDLDNLERDAEGDSHRHCAHGVIRYPETSDYAAQEGQFVYVKLSVTGDEHPVIQEYRKRKPSFPHESTVDQFFDEPQFEAYRALGDHAIEDLVSGVSDRAHGESRLGPRSTFREVAHWLSQLRITLAPRDRIQAVKGSLHDQYSTIEGLLQDELAAAYQSQLVEGLREVPEERIGGEERRVAYGIVGRQLRMIETALFQLRLDLRECREHPANRGWMNLFRRWSVSPLFRWGYALLAPTHSENFQVFCDAELGLALEVEWCRSSLAQLREAGVVSAERADVLQRESVGAGELFFVGRLGIADASSFEPAAPKVAFARVQVAQAVGALREVELRSGYDGSYLYRQALAGLRPFLTQFASSSAARDLDVDDMEPVTFLDPEDEGPPSDAGAGAGGWSLRVDELCIPAAHRNTVAVPE